MTTLLPAMTVFPADEQTRVRVTSQRYAIAMEDLDEELRLHMEQYIGTDRLAQWGPPDTARNALASICWALSVPGHYTREPTIIGATADVLQPIATPLWSAMQHGEYLAYALGAVAVLTERDPDSGGAVFDVVPPQHIWAIPHPSRPRQPAILRRLRVRDVDGKPTYVWDEWDLSGAEPSFRMVLAKSGGELGSTFGEVESGPAYPWRRPDGTPYMPWAIHRSWDVGDLWNWQRGRGVARGTLTAMSLQSACHRCAFNSTGKVAIIIGAVLSGVQIVDSGELGSTHASLEMEPGQLVHAVVTDGVTSPSVVEIGEVETLPALANYTRDYIAGLATDMGITPTDAARSGANPMSGVAISLTNEQRRDEQERARPLRAAADLEILRQAGWLLGIPVEGIGVTYHEIPRTPMDRQAQRDEEDSDLRRGFVSRVDLYMRQRPGVTREQAIAELQRVQREEAAVNAFAPMKPVEPAQPEGTDGTIQP